MSRELNLVPQLNTNTNGTVKSSKTILIVLILIVVSVGGSFGYVIGREFLLNKKVEDLKNEIALSNAKVKEKEELDQQIAATTQQITKAEQLKQLMDIDTDALIKELYKLVEVDGIKVSNITYIAGLKPAISINAKAPNKDTVEKIWANLRESDKFADSHINNWSGDDEITFSLNITVKGAA